MVLIVWKREQLEERERGWVQSWGRGLHWRLPGERLRIGSGWACPGSMKGGWGPCPDRLCSGIPGVWRGEGAGCSPEMTVKCPVLS